MTVRELLTQILETQLNLDSPACVRIIRRNEEGYIQGVRVVRVARWMGDGQMIVEQADVDAAEEGPP